MKEEKCHRYLRLLLMTFALAALSGCDWALFDSKGQVGAEQGRLILIAVGLMLIVVIPVIIMTFVFGWRYRSTNKDASYTPEWSHSYKIELVVWGVPLIIVAILAVLIWKTSHSLDPYRPLDSDKPPLHVEVVSLDWKWLFIYPEQGVAVVNELVIPEKTPVTFHITSDTTMNTLSIPQLGGMIYAMGGQRTQLNLIANEQGEFFGQSGNYSGIGFSAMRFTTHSVSDQAFEEWLEKARGADETLDFAAFKKLGERGEMVNHRYPIHPVKYYGQVEPNLFKTVIGQYVVGLDTKEPESTTAHSEAGAEE
ncbi:ubiquinol oxidase subunit II [Stutzerimonas kirkiae]|uniref:Ubiquinol oxidase subunit 2 n=1 Tax=Stutzerimonas kirkiae TaxID=2211392 RepID=A0A4Q9REA7_9GAMM|nr:ubiquinol oxidase subunit II [Stutzerimonas kirkiae]TBU98687.1 ubiquinol oxidase subunit II [Stutzerimonas kirkiae]TBV04317.1 ubiquinol oxidase subunit II [Stutzerimonas kirkiae]